MPIYSCFEGSWLCARKCGGEALSTMGRYIFLLLEQYCHKWLTFALRLVARGHGQVGGSSHGQQQSDGQQNSYEQHSGYHHQRPLQTGSLMPADEGDTLEEKEYR